MAMAALNVNRMHHQGVLRSIIQGVVAVGITSIVLNTWLLGGVVMPTVVTGDSMAPSLRGPHVQWSCADCGLAFGCDIEATPSVGHDAVCPHCGYKNDVDLGRVKPGQRVLINRSAYLLRNPRRWETVVLRSPDDPELLCVKRVVGLPGETVDIRGGDVVIDGAVARKQLPAQSALAVTVADQQIAADRWQPERPDSWVWHDGWCDHRAGTPNSIDWLVYHHVEPMAPGDGQESPILDGSASDQTESRQLNVVADILLRCIVEGTSSGLCFLRARSRGDEFRVTIFLASGAVRLTHNGTRVRAAKFGGKLPKSFAMELAIVDQQVHLSLADKSVLEFDYEPTEDSASKTGLAIGASDAALRVGKIEVLRDVYYTPGRGTGQFRLGPNEYFVLGDNSPHSVDSRNWSSRGGVSAGLLLGPALAW